MNLTGIISISGQSGLFKIVSQTKNGIIVEPLGGGRRFPVHGAQRVSSLEDISIYTYEEDVPLAEVFEKIFKKLNGKEAISPKSSAEELKAFMEECLPSFDQERVYNSDIKKVAQWYNLLLAEGLLKEEKKEEEKKAEAKASKPKPKPKATANAKSAPKVKSSTKSKASPKKDQSTKKSK